MNRNRGAHVEDIAWSPLASELKNSSQNGPPTDALHAHVQLHMPYPTHISPLQTPPESMRQSCNMNKLIMRLKQLASPSHLAQSVQLGRVCGVAQQGVQRQEALMQRGLQVTRAPAGCTHQLRRLQAGKQVDIPLCVRRPR